MSATLQICEGGGCHAFAAFLDMLDSKDRLAAKACRPDSPLPQIHGALAPGEVDRSRMVRMLSRPTVSG